MPKAVWVGSLEFGLVTIPVRLYPATEPRDVRFHLMDAQGRRVRYRRFVGAEPPVQTDDGTAEVGSPSSETSRQAAEVEDEIKKTLLHETGHFFGLSEEELEAMGLG